MQEIHTITQRSLIGYALPELKEGHGAGHGLASDKRGSALEDPQLSGMLQTRIGGGTEEEVFEGMIQRAMQSSDISHAGKYLAQLCTHYSSLAK